MCVDSFFLHHACNPSSARNVSTIFYGFIPQVWLGPYETNVPIGLLVRSLRINTIPPSRDSQCTPAFLY